MNILVDFNSREEEKLNIMQLDAGGDNRDGFALYWAEKYINQKISCDNKLIIVLSDGQPAHAYDECGDDEYSTYGDLKEIYPHLVQCRDLKRLTGQILNIVSKHLS